MSDAALQMLERAANHLLAVVAPGASRLVHTRVTLENTAPTASTDGASTIAMPTTFCGQDIPANEAVSVGLLAHELGHFLQPLKAVVEVAAEEGAPKWLVNVLLDIQGEALVESLFPAVAAPLAAVRACVKQEKLRAYRRTLAKAASFVEAAGPLALLGRFAQVDRPFSEQDAQNAVAPAFEAAGRRYLHLLKQAEELAPDDLPGHLRTLMRQCPELRQAQAPPSPLGDPQAQRNGALGDLLAEEARAQLRGWSCRPKSPLRIRHYTREAPRPEAERLARAIRTRFDVRRGGTEVLAPGRFDRQEMARGNVPFRMAVTGSERPLPKVVICVDVSSSMDERRKAETAFIAAQALALAVEAGGAVVGLLFDSCAGVSRTGDGIPLFAPAGQRRMADGTNFLFLTEAWRRWPRHRFLLVTDGQGTAPFALPADRERTAAIVIPPGDGTTLQPICGRIVELNRLDLLPSLLTLLLPRSDLA
jgi:hypothetical protein